MLTTITGPTLLPEAAALCILLTCAFVYFLFAARGLRRNQPTISSPQDTVLMIVSALLTATGTSYLLFGAQLSQSFLIVFFIITVIIAAAWRLLAHLYLRVQNALPGNQWRVLIVGSGPLAQQVISQFKQSNGRWSKAVECVGMVCDEADADAANLEIIGRLADTRHVVQDYKVDEVIIALSESERAIIDHLVTELHALPVQVHIVPTYLNLALCRATVRQEGNLLLVSLRDTALSEQQRLAKRLFDVMFSSVILLVALPFMLAVAVAVRLDSPGPVLFRQRRIGENGRPFTMFKFRSMVVNAEALFDQVIQEDENGNIIHKRRDDPRVTKIGKFIRRTSLDELPQLINVLIGDMSLVGPRPELPRLVEKYEPWQCKRLAVPQGITGWWQVNGRSEKLMHLHTEEDLYYVQNYSLALDLQILARTVPALLKRKGAY